MVFQPPASYPGLAHTVPNTARASLNIKTLFSLYLHLLLSHRPNQITWLSPESVWGKESPSGMNAGRELIAPLFAKTAPRLYVCVCTSKGIPMCTPVCTCTPVCVHACGCPKEHLQEAVCECSWVCLCVCTHMCTRVHIHSVRRCKRVDVCMHGHVIAPLSRYGSLGVSAYPDLPLGIYVPMQLGKEPEPRLGHGLGSGSSSRAFA